jgi:hypothetical protein
MKMTTSPLLFFSPPPHLHLGVEVGALTFRFEKPAIEDRDDPHRRDGKNEVLFRCSSHKNVPPAMSDDIPGRATERGNGLLLVSSRCRYPGNLKRDSYSSIFVLNVGDGQNGNACEKNGRKREGKKL